MRKRTVLLLTAVLFISGLLLTGCNVTPSTSSCAFVVGNGTGTYDAKLHKIIYPGQKVGYDTGSEIVSYVPCNSRNYIINDGTTINANKEPVGDRFVLIKATTSTGVPIEIAARALWTLNQNKEAMEAFYNVCFKYQCASEKDVSGDINFSTPGWNGMLAENLSYAMDSAARLAAAKVTDDIWKLHDQTQYQLLADEMSAAFADVMRANLGYSVDLFCGSGNSTWENPDNPGEGTFGCTPVRIVVDEVRRVAVQADESTAGAATINQQRLQNAEALYGSNAGFWLALQDTIEKCRQSGTACVFNIGEGSGFPVNVPASPTAIPTPTATPVKK